MRRARDTKSQRKSNALSLSRKEETAIREAAKRSSLTFQASSLDTKRVKYDRVSHEPPSYNRKT